ncbi:branched-chain amino acid ABC transporter permease [Natrarchaeobius oligotrophus]|uniref:Branched-chain amino acid ABC transporter permease n=1 Tax=Natrarchaeobius chitinivorans TaxID=1679083 RepID=A0A3N6M766_NATCH|nr:branched-chain amino acid ABC transporter permease [Natrarchaeobius chitinivorans]RQG99473.1 branched-chain amino acid ABC transporter permease [Natrarchaeobius chitinivorans]
MSVQATLLGLQIAMAYFLIVAGLVIIYGMMDVINVAHGSLYMLGAYIGLTLYDVVGNFFVILVVAPLLVGIIAAGLETLTIRPLYGRHPLYHILLTLGLALIIEEVVKIVWGVDTHRIPTPEVLSGQIVVGSVNFPRYRLFVIGISLLVAVAMYLVFTRTKFGIIMRASSSDAEMVDALGMDVSKVYTAVFVAGSMLAAFAGVLMGVTNAVTPTMGIDIIIIAFAILVIGGAGSLLGVVISSLIVGMLVAYVSLFAPAMSELIIYLLMAAVLIVKPSGLLGE